MFLLFILIMVFGSLGAGTQFSDASWRPNLALDLEGGTQIILTPRTETAEEITDEQVDQAIEIIRQRVDSSGVAEAEITSQAGSNIVVGLPGEPSEETLNLVRQSAQMRFRAFLAETGPAPIDPETVAEQGAPGDPGDLGGLDPEDLADMDPEELEELLDPEGEGAIPGEEPAQEDPADESNADAAMPRQSTGDDAESDDATEEDGATEENGATEEDAPAGPEPPDVPEETQELAREAADLDGDGEISDEPDTEPQHASDQAWITEQLLYDFYVLDCTDPANLIGGGGDDPEEPLVACSVDGSSKFILGPMEIPGTDISSASSGFRTTEGGTVTNEYEVQMQFTAEGAQKFQEVTSRISGQEYVASGTNRFAMVLDGLVLSAPTVQDPIPGGTASITGNFDRETAQRMASQLNFGALPIEFVVQSEEQISATLGSEQLQRGLLAGLLGLGLVVVYSAIQYRGLALVAVSSLTLAAGLTFGTIALLSWLQGYRLSLPGVAGLIVAIGITADSFIVYFERVRDEVREGRRLPDAVEQGWKRARRTILASDAVNILAAIVLYLIAVGGVRGFAFTLGLTMLIDIIVVMLFTYPIMQVLIRTKFFGEGSRLSGLDPEHLGAVVSAYRGRGQIRSAAERMTIAERRKAEAMAAAGASGESDTGDSGEGERR